VNARNDLFRLELIHRSNRKQKDVLREVNFPSTETPLAISEIFEIFSWRRSDGGASINDAHMSRKLKWFGGFLLAFGVVVAVVLYTHFDETVPIVAMGVNYFRYMNAPKGTIVIETAADLANRPRPSQPKDLHSDRDAGWPSYNKTLTF
jgi:hypothetical protein